MTISLLRPGRSLKAHNINGDPIQLEPQMVTDHQMITQMRGRGAGPGVKNGASGYAGTWYSYIDGHWYFMGENESPRVYPWVRVL